MLLRVALAFLALALPPLGAAHAAERKVIYFGGVGATEAEMHPCFPRFQTIPFVDGDARVTGVVDEIDDHPNQTYTVVGHSSGAAFAERVAMRVRNPAQIKLIELDGLGSAFVNKEVPDSACWYAARGTMESRNAESLKQDCRHVYRFENKSCRTQWCLHFSLVNDHASASLNEHNFRQEGYANCRGSVPWLR